MPLRCTTVSTIGAFSVVEKYLFLDLSFFQRFTKTYYYKGLVRNKKIAHLRPLQQLTSKPLKYETVTQLFFKDS